MICNNGEFIFSSERNIQIDSVFPYQEYMLMSLKKLYWDIIVFSFFHALCLIYAACEDDLSVCRINVNLFLAHSIYETTSVWFTQFNKAIVQTFVLILTKFHQIDLF